MEKTRSTVRLSLNGPLRILAPNGTRIELKSNKARGLLALLASDPQGRRERRWLEALLWGKTTPDKAKTCLRQELSKLRKILAPHGVVIAADRRALRLDLGSLHVLNDPAHGVFLEDLRISEAAFDAWLASQRQSRAPAFSSAPPALPPERMRRVVIACSSHKGPTQWFNRLLADTIARNIGEMLSLPVIIDDTAPDARETDLRFTCHMQDLSYGLGIRIALTRADSGQQLWAGSCEALPTGAPPLENPEVIALVTQAVTALRHHLFRLRHETPLIAPDMLCEKAIRGIFSFDANRVEAADALLAQAYEAHPRGLYLAARAQIRAIQRVERFLGKDEQVLIEEGEAFLARALEDEPSNSMVLAFASNTVGHLMRAPDRGLEFARRSARLNPSNAMAWWALSSATMYKGDVKTSLHYATRGVKLAEYSNFRFWWDQQAFGAVYALGRHDKALELVERVRRENAVFRPPLRYLISLYAHFEMHDALTGAIEAMKQLEPDFDIRRLYQDRSYPASLIHTAPGLNIEPMRDHFA